MANLIEQMNVLKGLDDASLQGEIQSPSGSAPPFLVLTEINRRKDMRQRYDSNKARQKPSTTVVEDMTFGLPAMPASTQGMPGGIGEAMGAPMPPVQGFSMGGLVDAVPGYAEGGVVDYSDMARRYNDRLAGLSGDRDRARAMALLAASGAILGGGSSNTLKNVGGGISAFAGSYGDQLRGIDSQELELLRGISNVGQAQSQMDMAALDQDFRERQLASQERQAAAAAEERANLSKDRFSATTLFGVDEKGEEVSARVNTTTGEYKPNPRADGTVPIAFIPYSADELTAQREQAKINVDKLRTLPAETAGVTDSLRQATTAMDTIKRAYNELNWANTGMVGAVSDVLPGGGWAKDARALIKTLQSGLAASALQAMRDASKTGGALGNVSDKDLELLQTKIVNLDPNQSEEQLREQLRVIYDELNSALQTRVVTFDRYYADVPGAETPELVLPPPTFEEFLAENVENDPMDVLVEKYRTQ
jgi:hypothetical protein